MPNSETDEVGPKRAAQRRDEVADVSSTRPLSRTPSLSRAEDLGHR